GQSEGPAAASRFCKSRPSVRGAAAWPAVIRANAGTRKARRAGGPFRAAALSALGLGARLGLDQAIERGLHVGQDLLARDVEAELTFFVEDVIGGHELVLEGVGHRVHVVDGGRML